MVVWARTGERDKLPAPAHLLLLVEAARRAHRRQGEDKMGIRAPTR